MKERLKYCVLCLAVIAFWLIPLVFGGFSWNADFIKAVAAYGLYTAAAFLCCLLPNRHAALIAAFVLGAGFCVLRPVAVYDIVPSLLLCCWLRCYTEGEKGNAVTVYFEVFTDLIYACFAASVIRLVINGYSFIKISTTDIRTVPELCLMVFVLLLFAVSFFSGKGKRLKEQKEKQKNPRRARRDVTGMIPVYVSLRTFFGFCVLLLAVSLLQYTNAKLMQETFLFFRTGFRLLFLPWIVLLFFVFETLFSRSHVCKRCFCE